MLPPNQQRDYYNNNMADFNKPKLQLRSGLTINPDKTPSPATKLLINHGKPNFTIQRSAKAQDGNANPLPPTPKLTASSQINNNNEFVVKSTTFNGVFKPSNISTSAKQSLHQNGNISGSNGTDNEAAKVVLRRAKVEQNEIRVDEDDEKVPEFIRRQRRIQERLANQNILDFENRRSGYFTQVLISPTNPNRQSFMETMASPAIKPGLEIPSPTTQSEHIKEEETTQEQQEQIEVKMSAETVLHAEPIIKNGQVEEEEVAKAIEEVNKAVEGEDDDRTELEEHAENNSQYMELQFIVDTTIATAIQHIEKTKPEEESEQETRPVVAVVTSPSSAIEKETTKEDDIGENLKAAEEPAVPQNVHVEAVCEEIKLNVNAEHVSLQNDHVASCNEITISHTNGLNGPTLPSPDPKGERGINFEPKTVVSFSQELGNNVNKYPDTVKVVKQVEVADNELKELTKLKFEITADDKDIEIKPVLTNEAA